MTAAQEYHDRIARYRLEEVALQRRIAWVGNSRFALFLWSVFQLWVTVYIHWLWLPFLLLPLALFIAFSLAFEKARRRLRRVQRALAWYGLGLARLEDRWMNLGVPGSEFGGEDHLYAADLDVFGPGSMFQRLCDAHTRVGRQTLARWLQGPPASIETIRARQEAVKDLGPRLEWREQLTLHGSGLPNGIDTARLDEWGNAVTVETSPYLKWVALALVGIMLGTCFAWLSGFLSIRPFLIALSVQILFALSLRGRVQRALDGLAGRSRDLLPLAGILTLIEKEVFAAPLTRRLQQELVATPGADAGALTPSERLHQLAGCIERLDARQNTFFALIAPFFLWTTRVGFEVERWRFETGPRLAHWIPIIGQFEALASLAGYAFENPDDCWPALAGDVPLLEGKQLGHPLLPRATCVRNDIHLNPERRLLLVSGSNMSGKSTYLRTIGLNTVLALAGGPVRGASLLLAPVAIGATLRIQDSLMKGQSRFFAEIRRLRAIVELTHGDLPVLFLLDEILHGTNSHDRRIGTEGILRSLLARRTIGLVTTHDLALTAIAEGLAPLAKNVHFADQMSDGQMHFDYRLHEGVVRHSNALALMKAVGLEVEVEQ